MDSLKRASAQSITAVIPYLAMLVKIEKWLRELQYLPNVADLLTVSGADRVVTLDLHSAQIQGFLIALLIICLQSPQWPVPGKIKLVLVTNLL